MRSLLFLFLIGFLTYQSRAQKDPIKWGKVELSELEMEYYSKDSSASAVILCDYGVSKVEYNKDHFEIKFSKHTRIKILKENGLDWANQQVLLYNNNKGSQERLSPIKGQTYNLVNGQVEKTKLKNSSEFREKWSEHYDKVKFTMPNARVGSIIEFEYQITSEFLFNFRDWAFQHSIPVAWSEYRTYIPEYYKYQLITQGYLPFYISTSEERLQNIQIQSKSRTGGTGFGNGAVKTTMQTSNIDLMEKYNRFVVKDAPAFKDEPYMTTRNNFISKVNYELAYIQWPQEPIKDIMGSWPKLNTQYLKSEYFGLAIKHATFLKKELENLSIGSLDEKEKVAKIYNHVKKKMRWNETNRKVISSKLKESYTKGEGSSADINLILTSMLQKAGIQADPILCSTRNHGIIRKMYPITEQFNNVLCKVTYSNDDYILLDATDPYLPMNILPKRCINGLGWVVSENRSGWVEIDSKNIQSYKVSGTLKMQDEEVSGQLKMEYGGYHARNKREECLSNGKESYKENRIKSSKWEIEELNLENIDHISSPFVETYTINSLNSGEFLGDVIYLESKFVKNISDNPFKLEKRSYPVNYPSKISDFYYVTLEIPEGYVVESLPSSSGFALPKKGAKYIIQYTVNDNKITVYSKMNIFQKLYTPDEYPYIKAFYDQIIAKEKELIVLKKI